MHRQLTVGLILLFACPVLAQSEETFVTIQKVEGNRMAVVKDAGGGRGMRSGAQSADVTSQPAGRGRFAGRRPGGMTTAQSAIITVPATAKITSGMRERRTSEFRAGAELAGGLKNRIFQNIQQPLSARIVTEGDRILEINVITAETDINQSNTDSAGQAVIAIRPKRPPMKRK
ncbi:MAG: hypothetical protein O2820_11165 [Planctomycetota bacterium]|nr:hypothetical protein [Planctomycetota bacterium]MDA1249768.1 hypothetical protein [Planctomycetota bacterium]